jgi:hypothetical protein
MLAKFRLLAKHKTFISHNCKYVKGCPIASMLRVVQVIVIVIIIIIIIVVVVVIIIIIIVIVITTEVVQNVLRHTFYCKILRTC